MMKMQLKMSFGVISMKCIHPLSLVLLGQFLLPLYGKENWQMRKG